MPSPADLKQLYRQHRLFTLAMHTIGNRMGKAPSPSQIRIYQSLAARKGMLEAEIAQLAHTMHQDATMSADDQNALLTQAQMEADALWLQIQNDLAAYLVLVQDWQVANDELNQEDVVENRLSEDTTAAVVAAAEDEASAIAAAAPQPEPTPAIQEFEAMMKAAGIATVEGLGAVSAAVAGGLAGAVEEAGEELGADARDEAKAVASMLPKPTPFPTGAAGS